MAVGLSGRLVFAQGSGSAARELADYYLVGAPVSVVISLVPSPGVAVVGAEDAPPPGWQVSNITQSGSFDPLSGKVKWGPFFSPSIPSDLSYDATPPVGTTGPRCFEGTASFDGANQSIGGDSCIVVGVPAVGHGALIAWLGLLAAAGVFVLSRRGSVRALSP